jgi:hypothetical protein
MGRVNHERRWNTWEVAGMSVEDMSKTQEELILDWLWSVSPEGATNSQIRQGTGIKSHQQVYMLTRQLMGAGYVRGQRCGQEWVFWIDEPLATQLASPGPASRSRVHAQAAKRLSPRAFEALAQKVMSDHFQLRLTPGEVPGVPKRFDLVSPDKDIVGDAKYYTFVRGQRLPPAKFSVVAEYVWLLEKTEAAVKFLVFGNDRQVPQLWLKRYGHLAADIPFYFLADSGRLEQLTGTP